MEKRQSSAANRNEAFRQCSKPWICFMDDDAALGSTATLQQLLDVMVETGASLAGPKLLTPAGHIYSGVPCADPLSLELRVAGLGEQDRGQHDVVALVPWLPSTVLMMHRSVMLATGGFDQRYGGSQHEDADFSLRARARGFQCCYHGLAAATHFNNLRNGQFARNGAYFNARWQNRPDLFTAAVTVPQRHAARKQGVTPPGPPHPDR
jgi:GT2 family glycosyltransferase